MTRWQYTTDVHEDLDGWRVVVVGCAQVWVSGPHPSGDAAQRALWQLVRRWRARAAALGGRVWRPDGHTIGVLLPDGVVPREALPFERAPCTVTPGR